VSVDVPGSLTTTVGTYTFQAGYNCYTCPSTSGTATFDVTVGAVTRQLSMPYLWTSSTYDFLNVGGSNTASFDLGGGVTLNVTALSLGQIASRYQIEEAVSGDVNARFDVVAPEPSSLLLIGAGLLVLGWRARKLI
jgi:hypothetical protein